MLKQDSFDDIAKITLSVAEGKSLCSFIPEFGATIIELQLASTSVLDGFKSAKQLRANEKSRSIWLLPFPNRIKDGRFVFEGREYVLPINKPKENNAIHGFAWNRKFDVSENGSSVFLRHDYIGDYPGFPFPFTVMLKYELSQNSFTAEIDVVNTGKSKMPFGIGWHPYFTFQKPVDDLQLQLPACNILETDERLIPTGERNSFNQFHAFQTIGSQAFDDAFEFTGAGNFFETKLRNPVSGKIITIEQDSGFKYLQIFTPPERNSIAIEPMTCPANVFNTGEALMVLKENESFQGKIKVSLD